MVNENKNETILLVDDEAPVRRPLHRKLTKIGYICLEAENSDHAMDTLGSKRVELAILDIVMPGKSGMELLPEIRDGFPETAVIMATAIAEPGIIIQCMKSGAQDYITKPFNLDFVVHAVDTVLRKRHLELMMRDYQASLQGKVDEQAKQIRRLFLGAVESLITALESKDTYTAGHSRRVNDYAILLSTYLGLSDEEKEDLRWGALLHDVGKIAVDPTIQNKPGKLTQEEYAELMTHTQVGPRIVKPVANEAILNIIKYHHTRFDGSASGQSQFGSQLPIGVRIVTLADSFDAMTSDRPYRKACSSGEAITELKRCSGTQFDPTLVDTFTRIPEKEIQAIIHGEIPNDQET